MSVGDVEGIIRKGRVQKTGMFGRKRSPVQTPGRSRGADSVDKGLHDSSGMCVLYSFFNTS